MGKASIKIYYDVVSPYAWMGVELLQRYQKAWGNSVSVDFIPFFLGGIMAGASNRPPASVPRTFSPLMLFTVCLHDSC